MNIIEQLDNRLDLQYLLFRRGWIISTEGYSYESLNKFPFYGNWNHVEKQGYNFYVHKDNQVHFAESEQCCVFLIGHSYNPFTMEWVEKNQLQRIAEAYGTTEFQDRIDELTGIFIIGCITGNDLDFIVDPSGIQSAYCGKVKNSLILTSHPQVVADIYDCQFDSRIKEIVEYKWYPRVLGPFLPGDLCQFKELKRIVPNIYYTYKLSSNSIVTRRIYPLYDINEAENTEEYVGIISTGADILKRNIRLVVEKWDRPAISLTGGVDSQTTFAAANGIYDKISAFSYLSNREETIDIVAAKKISQKFNVPYELYEIPIDSALIKDYELKKEILQHNTGYIAELKPNEIRKRIILERDAQFDVEIKSWVSETIRACQYKRYRKKTMPGLSPQLFRNLYKIFITNRSLAHKVDKIFEDYISTYEYDKIPSGYDITDMYFWEVGWGTWGAVNISGMMYYSDITIIYNNRKFLDLLLRVPLKKRINDVSHRDMKKCLNKELFDMGIEVVNMSEDWRRAAFLRLIFELNMFLKK